MDPVISAFILGLVQGLGEFLPVSSSGHLVLMQNLLGLEEPELFLNLILHVGTLAAVIFFYRREVGALLKELALTPAHLKADGGLRLAWQSRPDFKLGLLVVIGSVPAALAGLSLKSHLEPLFASTHFVGAALLGTGLVVYFTGRRPDGSRGLAQFTALDALLIGAGQALAIAPGLSRSGLTIGLALLLGLRREMGARYSFILSIPAILGATLLEARQGLDGYFNPASLAVGFLAAAAIGYLALTFLIKIIKGGHFHWFAFWCWGVGLLTLCFL